MCVCYVHVHVYTELYLCDCVDVLECPVTKPLLLSTGQCSWRVSSARPSGGSLGLQDPGHTPLRSPAKWEEEGSGRSVHWGRDGDSHVC